MAAGNWDLPETVRLIAEVTGREDALYLIGQLPTCYAGKAGHQSRRIILYVPRKLARDHRLVEILGWECANRLVEGFGGEILQPGNCKGVHQRFRDNEVRRLAIEGMKVSDLAAMVGVSERHIRSIVRV